MIEPNRIVGEASYGIAKVRRSLKGLGGLFRGLAGDKDKDQKERRNMSDCRHFCLTGPTGGE